ncbi:MAG: glycosyltransferase family 39 protein [Sedimentisphaerales bacterium]|nr:glycosyltransferase family 39 protein [Sedimentisphaerales bacterium]
MSPSQTVLNEYQHPGYPIFILAASKVIGLFYNGGQLFLFIYSAQAAALLFRIFTIIVLYFFAKELSGARHAFWSILILIFLPKPAEYGSDALSDWPHMFFLAAGMLLLLYGAKCGKWRLFALTGLAGGLGYLVRPEGAQVVIYGSCWLVLQLIWKRRTLSKSNAVLGLAAMVICFIITAGPYMKFKGAIFPKKGVGTFSSYYPLDEINKTRIFYFDGYNAAAVPSETVKAFIKIFENVGDTLVWFFLLPYLIGIFLHFKKQKLIEPEHFFIIALVILNILIMIWLYCSHGYMSGRHTLPLVVFTIFYIPAGIDALASWLNIKYSKGFEHTHRWFAILMVIGIAICALRLLIPLHSDKLFYRKAAQWLAQNTESSAIIGVPDYRISFYAERKSIKMPDEKIPEAAGYVVKAVDKTENVQELTKEQRFQKVFSVESDNDKEEIIIYKRINN